MLLYDENLSCCGSGSGLFKEKNQRMMEVWFLHEGILEWSVVILGRICGEEELDCSKKWI